MRRFGWLLIGLALVGCGGTAPVATPSVPESPTANVAATSTRSAEVAQIATLTAPTAAPSLLAAAPSTPTDVIPTPLVPTKDPATPTPVANAGGPILTVVTVQGSDPANVRAAPDSASSVIALVGAGSDVMVMTGADVPDAIGQLWVPVSVAGRGGYIRSDLVGPRHVSSMPFPGIFPTPIFLATLVPPTPIVRATPTPSGTGDIYADYPLINPADWAKRPEFYTGKRFSVLGTIFNVREVNDTTFIQMYAGNQDTNDVPVAIDYRGTSTSLQKGVRLRVGGVGEGVFSGTNSFGGSIGQPLLAADWVSDPTNASSARQATTMAAPVVENAATVTASARESAIFVATLVAPYTATATARIAGGGNAATRNPSPIPHPTAHP